MNKRPPRLSEIANESRRCEAKELRAMLFKRCRAAINQMGDGIAGFALVVWDREGDMRTAYDAERGPIRAPLVPTLVSDALNRHLAVMLTEERMKNGEQ